MAVLEDLKPGGSIRGVLPNGLVTVVSVQWFGSDAIELTYKDAAGKVGNELLYRDRRGRPRSRRGRPALELRRRRRPVPARLRGPAHPPRPSVRPGAGRPHLGRRAAAAPDHGRLREHAAAPAAALPARRRSRRRQDHHGGPPHQGADRPRRPAALPDRLPGQPGRAVAGRALSPLPPAVRDPDQRQARGRAHRQLVPGDQPRHRPARQARRATRMCSRSCRRPIAAGTSSSATRRTRCRPRSSAARSSTPSATGSGSCSRQLTRHFLLMTATPHNGKEEDFQLFMALLDGDRFEGKFRDGVHAADVSDLMRRMVKENLLKFDGTPLFPERIAYTVPYKLSDAEAAALQGSDRLRARGVQSRRGAGERQARRHGRLRADHPPAPARLVARGDLPVAAPPPRAAGKPAARAGSAAARRPGRRRARCAGLPLLDKEDVEDLDDAPDAEVEAAEEEVLDQATAARSIDELRIEIETLKRLEALALVDPAQRRGQEVARAGDPARRDLHAGCRSRTASPKTLRPTTRACRCRRSPRRRRTRSSSSSPSTATR